MIKYRKLSEIVPLDYNPRKITDFALQQLAESIKVNPDYFEARPIILSNRTGQNVILAGNKRFEAAELLGLDEVPTFLIEGLTEEREREIVIRDNVNNGEWDMEALQMQFDELELSDWGLQVHFEVSVPEGENDPEKEFEKNGGLAYSNEKVPEYKALIVHFDTEEDYIRFQSLLDLSLTEKTKSTFYPAKDNVKFPTVYA